MNMFIKIENPKGSRVQDVFINNKLIDMERIYFVAFVTVQGVPKKYGRSRKNLKINAIDALKQYVETKKIVSPKLRETVKLI